MTKIKSLTSFILALILLLTPCLVDVEAEQGGIRSRNLGLTVAYRDKDVRAGSWRTLDSFWNAGATEAFMRPSDAKIRIRYGFWKFTKDRQIQTLDGRNEKRLNVSNFWTLFGAKTQMYIPGGGSTRVIYAYIPGGAPKSFKIKW